MAVSREHLQGNKSSLHFVREISSERGLDWRDGETALKLVYDWNEIEMKD
jgi:hypothetical protein